MSALEFTRLTFSWVSKRTLTSLVVGQRSALLLMVWARSRWRASDWLTIFRSDTECSCGLRPINSNENRRSPNESRSHKSQATSEVRAWGSVSLLDCAQRQAERAPGG